MRLLSATVRELAVSGYSELRTAAVAERAGVSQGTVFSHFGTKTALVAAAVEFHFERALRPDAVAIRPDESIEARAERLLHVMWREMCSDEYLGVLEVYSAARTNLELREALVPIAIAELKRASAIGNLVLSRVAGHSGAESVARGAYDPLIATLVYTLQAAAREAAALGQTSPPKPLLAFLQRQIVGALSVAAGPSPSL